MTTALSRSLAIDLANEDPNIFSGPTLGPLTDSMTISDGCHHNSAGEDFTGAQMLAFFN